MATTSEVMIQESILRAATNALSELIPAYERYEAYYVGDHPLEFATDRWLEAFGDVFENFSDNWCQVVVDAAVDRMEIIGWKSEDKEKDAKVAEEIWDSAELGIEEEEVHTQTFVKGDAYLIGWPDPEDEEQTDPELFYNDATLVTVSYNPTNRREIIRAAKRYDDRDGNKFMFLYFPDRVEKWMIPQNASTLQEWAVMEDLTLPESGWARIERIDNPYGIVPVFHFKNRALGARDFGVSELKVVIPIQNTINKLLMDLMVGSEFGSYRQKYMAGGGHPKDGWKAGGNRVWATTDPNAKFGEFGQIDLEPLVKAIDLAVGHVAKITGTPLHYLRSSGDMPSGEALKTAESALIKKVKRRQKTWGSQWSKAMGFAYRIKTGAFPKSPLIPVWRSPETRHELEQAQTAQLKSILGIPLRQLWSEHFGYSEEEIAQFEAENKAVAAQVLARVIGQVGQLPPGMENVALDAEQLVALMKSDPETKGNENRGTGLDVSQILALLPKGTTGQTTAGEATTKPQANSRPPASPTRRSSGFKD